MADADATPRVNGRRTGFDGADRLADLADRVAALEAENDDLRRRLDAVSRANRWLREVVVGDADADTHEIALADRLDTLADRLDDLEAAAPDPDRLAYEDMSQADRVAKIRRHLVEKAADRGGKARMTADEIQALFDGHPSTGYPYKLMEAVAHADGFDVGYPGGRQDDGRKRVTVDTERVNDQALRSRCEQ